MREGMGDLHLGLDPSRVISALQQAGFEEIAQRELLDSYVVQGKDHKEVNLSMFLVAGRWPGAEHHSQSNTSKSNQRK